MIEYYTERNVTIIVDEEYWQYRDFCDWCINLCKDRLDEFSKTPLTKNHLCEIYITKESTSKNEYQIDAKFMYDLEKKHFVFYKINTLSHKEMKELGFNRKVLKWLNKK